MATLTATPSRILRNIKAQGIAQAYGAAINLLLPIVIVRLGVENVELYQLGMVFFVIFRVVSDLGVGPLSIRDVARKRDGLARYQVAQLRVRVGSGLGCLAIMALSGVLFYRRSAATIIGCFALAMLLETLAEGFRWVFRATQQMKRDAMCGMLERTSTLVLTAVSVFELDSVIACALSVAAGQLVNLACAVVLSTPVRRGAPPAPGPRLERYLVRVGPSFMVMGATYVLYSRIDYLILDKWPTLSDLEVGLYALAYLPLKGLLMVPEVVMMAMFPAFSELFHADRERLQTSVWTAFRLLTALTLGAALAIVALHGVVSGVILIFHKGGEDTSALGPLLMVLILSAPLYTVTSISGHIMAATGRQLRLTLWYSAAVLFNVAGNVAYAIPHHGTLGCAVMTVVTEAVLCNTLVQALPADLRRTLRLPALLLTLLIGVVTVAVIVVTR